MTLLFAGIMAVLLIGLDQLVKFLINLHLPQGYTIPIWENVLHITHVENTGAVFSLFAGQQWLLIYLTAAIILVLIALLAFKKIKQPFLIYAISSVIAGGIGNLIDRILHGSVTDFIDVRLINFAVFNIADCCVVIGCILILVYILFLDKPQAQPAEDQPTEEQLTEDQPLLEEETQDAAED